MIYIASPYSHPDENIRINRFKKVSLYVADLVSKGYLAISPITYGHTLLDYKEMPTDFEFWENFCIGLLSKSDVMYVYKLDGWDTSKGVLNEIKYAENNNIPIVYVVEKYPKLEDLKKIDFKYFDMAIHHDEIYHLANGENDYDDNIGFHQFGVCSNCNINLSSWSKYVECPKCNTYKYLT